MMRLRT